MKIKVLAIVAIIFILFSFWYFSTTQVLKRRMNDLMGVATIEATSAPAMRQTKVFSLNAILAEEIKLELKDIPMGRGTFNKQDVEEAFSWMLRSVDSSSFEVTEFSDIKVGDGSATVKATIKGYAKRSGRNWVHGPIKVFTEWTQADDGWRIKSLVWE